LESKTKTKGLTIQDIQNLLLL